MIMLRKTSRSPSRSASNLRSLLGTDNGVTGDVTKVGEAMALHPQVSAFLSSGDGRAHREWVGGGVTHGVPHKEAGEHEEPIIVLFRDEKWSEVIVGEARIRDASQEQVSNGGRNKRDCGCQPRKVAHTIDSAGGCVALQ